MKSVDEIAMAVAGEFFLSVGLGTNERPVHGEYPRRLANLIAAAIKQTRGETSACVQRVLAHIEGRDEKTFGCLSEDCFGCKLQKAHDLAIKQARVEALAALRVDVELAKRVLGEALQGARYDDSWVQPMRLPLSERVDLYKRAVAYLDRALIDAEAEGGER
jgi:hypothetical protein